MAKIDEKKAKLDEFKTYRNFALTSLLALIAFIATKFGETKSLIIYLSIFAIVVLGIAVFIFQQYILKIIKQIGEL